MRLKVEAVDPASMQAVRDITDLISSEAGHIDRSLDADIPETGELHFAGMAAWLANLVRITAIDDRDDTAYVLGTFFATPSDVKRVQSLLTGTIHLDGTLLALSSTLLPSTYVATTGMTCQQVIMDMCRIAGRAERIAQCASAGNARYSEPTFYEAGTSVLDICKEAATKANLRLASDREGYIIIRPTEPDGGQWQLWTTSATDTDIISEIDKGLAWMQSPTRVIATYSDSEVTLSASAAIENSPMDADTRGRHIDAHVNVTDLASPSLISLRSEAEKALAQAQADVVWKFDSLFRDFDAGVPARVWEIDDSIILDGEVSNVSITLDAMMTMSVTVRGETR